MKNKEVLLQISYPKKMKSRKATLEAIAPLKTENPVDQGLEEDLELMATLEPVKKIKKQRPVMRQPVR